MADRLNSEKLRHAVSRSSQQVASEVPKTFKSLRLIFIVLTALIPVVVISLLVLLFIVVLR